MTKTEEEAWCLFETLSDNSRYHASTDSQSWMRSPTLLNKGSLEEEEPSDEATQLDEEFYPEHTNAEARHTSDSQDVTDNVVDDNIMTILAKDPLDICLTSSDIDSFDVDGSIVEVNARLDTSNAGGHLPWYKQVVTILG